MGRKAELNKKLYNKMVAADLRERPTKTDTDAFNLLFALRELHRMDIVPLHKLHTRLRMRLEMIEQLIQMARNLGLRGNSGDLRDLTEVHLITRDDCSCYCCEAERWVKKNGDEMK